MVNTQQICRAMYRLAGSERTAWAAARSVRPFVLARPVAWANSFSMASVGKRISTRPIANTYEGAIAPLPFASIAVPQLGHVAGFTGARGAALPLPTAGAVIV